MESSDLNSINDVETDRASFHLPTEEITCETERHLAAGSKQEFLVRYPPDFTAPKLLAEVVQVTTADLYQCAMNEREYGSGSDSAEEEHSPFSSTEKLRYEGLAPTGYWKETRVLRTQPTTPPDANDVPRAVYKTTQLTQMHIVNHSSKSKQQEVGDHETTDALVLTGSNTERRKCRQPNIKPRGEMETPFNYDVSTRRSVVSQDVQCSVGSYGDEDVRLTTFFSQAIYWPHKNPSPEKMARAGMIYKGVFTIDGKEVYDMVKCYKCGKTLYGFTENDDPVEEHRKFYPDCH